MVSWSMIDRNHQQHHYQARDGHGSLVADFLSEQQQLFLATRRYLDQWFGAETNVH